MRRSSCSGIGEGPVGDARAGAPGRRRRGQGGAPQGDPPGRRRRSARRGRQGRRRGRPGRGDHRPRRRSGTAGPLAGPQRRLGSDHRIGGPIGELGCLPRRSPRARARPEHGRRSAQRWRGGDLRDDDLVRPAGTTVAWARLAEMPELLEAAPSPSHHPQSPTGAGARRPARSRRRGCSPEPSDFEVQADDFGVGPLDSAGPDARGHPTGSSSRADPDDVRSRSSTTSRPSRSRAPAARRSSSPLRRADGSGPRTMTTDEEDDDDFDGELDERCRATPAPDDLEILDDESMPTSCPRRRAPSTRRRVERQPVQPCGSSGRRRRAAGTTPDADEVEDEERFLALAQRAGDRRRARPGTDGRRRLSARLVLHGDRADRALQDARDSQADPPSRRPAPSRRVGRERSTIFKDDYILVEIDAAGRDEDRSRAGCRRHERAGRAAAIGARDDPSQGDVALGGLCDAASQCGAGLSTRPTRSAWAS